MQSIARSSTSPRRCSCSLLGPGAHSKGPHLHSRLGASVPGHPTIGTAFVLASIGDAAWSAEGASIVLEEGVGPVAVSIRARQGRPGCELTAARLPEEGPPPPPLEEIASALSLRPEDLRANDLPPRGFTCGVPYLFVPLRDEGSQRGRASTCLPGNGRSRAGGPRRYFPSPRPSAATARTSGQDVRPSAGVPETRPRGPPPPRWPASLPPRVGRSMGTLRWVVDQGVEMGRPSRLHITCERSGGRISAVRVGAPRCWFPKDGCRFRPRHRLHS